MSLKKNVVSNFVGQGWSAIMGIAFIPIYINYLGVEAYGLIGFYTVMQTCLILFDMGITQALMREMAIFKAGAHTPRSIRNLLRSLEVISVFVALLMSALMLFLSNYISLDWLKGQTLSSQTIKDAVVLMGFVISLRFIEGVYKGALLGLQKQVLVNIISVIIATMRYGIVVLILEFYGSNVQIFFEWQIFSSFLSVVTLIFFVYKTLPLSGEPSQFSRRAISGVWKFASGMTGITLLNLLLTQIDKVLLSTLIDLDEYGYYTLAAVMAGGLALITIPITQAIYPKLVEHVAQDKKVELVKLYHQGAQLITVLITPVALTLIFFSRDIIFLWSGNFQLADKVSPILIPLVFGNFLNCLLWMPIQLQFAHGYTGLIVKVNAVAVFIFVPILFWVAPRYGAIGAAWVWALLNVGFISIGVHFMYKRLLTREKWNWYCDDILKQLFFSILVILLIYFMTLKLTEGLISKVLIYIFGLCLAICLASWQSSSIRPLLLDAFNKWKKFK